MQTLRHLQLHRDLDHFQVDLGSAGSSSLVTSVTCFGVFKLLLLRLQLDSAEIACATDSIGAVDSCGTEVLAPRRSLILILIFW